MLYVEVIERRIEEYRNRPEHDHSRNGDRNLLSTAADDGLRRHDRGRATDRTAGSDQHRRLSIELEQPRADRVREQERRREHDRVDEHTGEPDTPDILERQPQPVENDAGPQQVLLCERDTGRACAGNVLVEGIAGDHAEDDSESERADAVGREPARAAERHRKARDGSDQRDAGQPRYRG